MARLVLRQISLQANYNTTFFSRRGISQVLLRAGLGGEFDKGLVLSLLC